MAMKGCEKGSPFPSDVGSTESQLILKLAMLTLCVHYEPFNSNEPKNASTLWNFYCSPINVFGLSLSGYASATDPGFIRMR